MDINELNETIAKLKSVAEQGDTEAQYQIGLCYEQEKNYPQAAKWLKKAAKQRGASIPYNLGSCYYQGVGVEQNYAEAIHWFHKAMKK